MDITELIVVVLLQVFCLLCGLFIGFYRGLNYGLKTNEQKMQKRSRKTWYLKPLWKLSDKIEQQTKELENKGQ